MVGLSGGMAEAMPSPKIFPRTSLSARTANNLLTRKLLAADIGGTASS
jgi:hypothetical protein